VRVIRLATPVYDITGERPFKTSLAIWQSRARAHVNEIGGASHQTNADARAATNRAETLVRAH
jgi:hypothetical protein